MAVVLLIEDNKSTRLLTKLNLQQEYQILEAGNGLEALDILEQQHIDLIIADIMMPHMDGYEFVRQLRCIDQMTPILFLTARKDWQDMKNGFALGIDDYMTKPVHYEELLWRVRALLRRARINNEKSIRIGDVVIDGENYIIMRGTEIISLPRKEFELLFDRYYQGDSSHETAGFGLGLSIVKKIVELCNGSIQIDSMPGEGTSIKILL